MILTIATYISFGRGGGTSPFSIHEGRLSLWLRKRSISNRLRTTLPPRAPRARIVVWFIPVIGLEKGLAMHDQDRISNGNTLLVCSKDLVEGGDTLDKPKGKMAAAALGNPHAAGPKSGEDRYAIGFVASPLKPLGAYGAAIQLDRSGRLLLMLATLALERLLELPDLPRLHFLTCHGAKPARC